MNNIGELANPNSLERLGFGGEMLLAAHLVEVHVERRQRERERERRKAAASKDIRKATLGSQEM